MISGRQLHDHMSPGAAKWLVSSGALEPIWRGVYLVRGAPHSYAAQLWSAVLSSNGVLGFGTAAHLWGAVDEQPPRIDVIVARSLHQWRRPDVRIHRIDVPPWAIARRQGLPVTSRAETLLDHIGRLPRGQSFRLADRAIQVGWLAPDDFARRVRQQPGRTGNRRMRELSQVVGDRAAAHSERVLHRLLRRAGLPDFEANYDVWAAGALVAVVDVAFPQSRVAVEIDGFAFHHAPDRFQRDRTRQNALVGLGWTVLRFTWADVIEQPDYVIATIRRHLRDRGSLGA